MSSNFEVQSIVSLSLFQKSFLRETSSFLFISSSRIKRIAYCAFWSRRFQQKVWFWIRTSDQKFGLEFPILNKQFIMKPFDVPFSSASVLSLKMVAELPRFDLQTRFEIVWKISNLRFVSFVLIEFIERIVSLWRGSIYREPFKCLLRH